MKNVVRLDVASKKTKKQKANACTSTCEEIICLPISLSMNTFCYQIQDGSHHPHPKKACEACRS